MTSRRRRRRRRPAASGVTRCLAELPLPPPGIPFFVARRSAGDQCALCREARLEGDPSCLISSASLLSRLRHQQVLAVTKVRCPAMLRRWRSGGGKEAQEQEQEQEQR